MENYIHQKHYEQILELAKMDSVVYRSLQMYHRGEVTWDEMLIMAVGYLVADNMALQKTLQDKIERSVQPIIVHLKNP